MGRLFSIFGSAAISVAVIFANNNAMFRAIGNLRKSNERSESAGDRESKKKRLPPMLQSAIDQSNADAQRKFQAVRDHVDAQLMQSRSMGKEINGYRGRSKRSLKSGYATSAKRSAKQRPAKTQDGEVTLNPYLD